MPDDTTDLRRWLSTPLTTHRLRDTPLCDLVRGRLTGRLAWRARLARAALPAPIADVIARVVRRSRLWRIEKASVADELIAHFADGLAGGASPDNLIRDFGDADVAARLIRRAAIRNRPLAWHAVKWTRRLITVLIVLYAIAFAGFWFGRPTIRVDYLAPLNVAATEVPLVDRAWPVYVDAERLFLRRDAEIYLRLNAAEVEANRNARDRFLIDATPADPQWPRLVTLVDSLRAEVDRICAASRQPSLGFVFGRNGYELGDPDAVAAHLAKMPSWFARSLATAQPPPFNGRMTTFVVLAADARVARTRGDASRALGDVNAILAIARQVQGPFEYQQYGSRSIFAVALAEVQATLVETPTLLDDAALVGLAHRIVAAIPGETAAALVDKRATRDAFADLMQRLYTDDGHGDGRPTREAIDARTIEQLHPWRDFGDDDARGIATRAIAKGVIAVAGSSRREVLAEFDRLMDAQDALLSRPLRDVEHDAAWITQHSLERMQDSPTYLARYAPIVLAAWGIGAPAGHDASDAERLFGQRDGVEVGIALELYRRHRGTWPATLDALVPTLLPHVPIDRFDGQPIRYRLIDNAPVVYSVGNDRHDDGGRPAIDWRSRDATVTTPIAAAERRFDYGWPLHGGDWILFDARRVVPATRPAE